MTRKRNVTTSMKATLWHLLEWISITDLATKRNVTRAPTVRALARLQKLGLAERMDTRGTVHAVRVYWRCTSKGLEALQSDTSYVLPVIKREPPPPPEPSHNPFNWRAYVQPVQVVGSVGVNT